MWREEMKCRLTRFAAVVLAAMTFFQSGVAGTMTAMAADTVSVSYKDTDSRAYAEAEEPIENNRLKVKVKKSGKDIDFLYKDHIQKNRLNTIIDDSFYAVLSVNGGKIKSVSYNHVADYKYVVAQYRTTSCNYAKESRYNKAVSVKSSATRKPQKIEYVDKEKTQTITPFSVSWNGTYLEIHRSEDYVMNTRHMLARGSAKVYVDVTAIVRGKLMIKRNVKIPIQVVEKAGSNVIWQSVTDKNSTSKNLYQSISVNAVEKDGRKYITVSDNALMKKISDASAKAEIFTDGKKNPETGTYYQNRDCQKIAKVEIGTKGYTTKKSYVDSKGQKITLDDAIDVYAKIGDRLVQVDTEFGLDGFRADTLELYAFPRTDVKTGKKLDIVVKVWFEGQSRYQQLKRYNVRIRTVS
jgi:hypothetical protein